MKNLNKYLLTIALLSFLSLNLFGSICKDQDSFIQLSPGESLFGAGFQFNKTDFIVLSSAQIVVLNRALKKMQSFKFELTSAGSNAIIKVTVIDGTPTPYNFSLDKNLSSALTKPEFIFKTNNMNEFKALSFDTLFFVKYQDNSELISISGQAPPPPPKSGDLKALNSAISSATTKWNLVPMIKALPDFINGRYSKTQVIKAVASSGFRAYKNYVIASLYPQS